MHELYVHFCKPLCENAYQTMLSGEHFPWMMLNVAILLKIKHFSTYVIW